MKVIVLRLIPILLAVALASLSGCAHFEAIPLHAGDTASAVTARSLGDPGLRKFLASQKSSGGAWTVDRLALAAAYFNGDVRVARALAEEAAAAIATAEQRPNPVLSFSPGYNVSSQGISPWIITPSLDVTIETAGKRGKRSAQARAAAEAAQLRVASAAWDARTKVRAAMLDLYAAQQNKALLEAEAALHEDALKKLAAQIAAGEASMFEQTQARLSLNRSKLALHDAEKLAATARAQLAAAIGVSASAIQSERLDFSSFHSLPSSPGAQARRRALTHRADLLALLADYAAADAALRLEIAKQYPDVKLSPGYQLDQNESKWSLGLAVELPLLNQNRGPIAQAGAKRKTAGAMFEARQAAVLGEIETALAAYRAAQSKAATAAQLADEAAKASDTTKRMVEAGEITPLELVRRRIEASAAELSKLDARIQAQQAVGQLEAAMQLRLR